MLKCNDFYTNNAMTHRPLRSAIALSCIAFCWLSAGIALADGLQSQNKLRVPQATVLTPRTDSRGHVIPNQPLIVPTSVSDEEKIGMMVRRKARLLARKDRLSQGVQAAKDMNATNPGTDRANLIHRGMLKQPQKCQLLHTHDRATCLRDSGLMRMNRFQVAER